jgi:hypothetical protein
MPILPERTKPEARPNVLRRRCSPKAIRLSESETDHLVALSRDRVGPGSSYEPA